ncbi:hypothetical protein I546_5242 [Mycobacterium kansasii 732]|nr:hypothetical protein I546_5242 [Mycobacterium kansasii 732]
MLTPAPRHRRVVESQVITFHPEVTPQPRPNDPTSSGNSILILSTSPGLAASPKLADAARR